MKKTFLILSLLAAFQSAVWSQAIIKAGINIATMGQEDQNVSRSDIRNHSIVGPVVGIAGDLNIVNFFAIHPELLYSQSGGRNTYDFLGTTTETTYRINYLELPVLAKLKFGGATGGLYVAAGPFLGFALSGKSKVVTDVGGSQVVSEKKYTFDDQDNARRLNYGVVGAAGVRLGNVTFDVRYNYGINNLLDKDADNNNDNKPVLQTRGIALTLGFGF